MQNRVNIQFFYCMGIQQVKKASFIDKKCFYLQCRCNCCHKLFIYKCLILSYSLLFVYINQYSFYPFWNLCRIFYFQGSFVMVSFHMYPNYQFINLPVRPSFSTCSIFFCNMVQNHGKLGNVCDAILIPTGNYVGRWRCLLSIKDVTLHSCHFSKFGLSILRLSDIQQGMRSQLFLLSENYKHHE